MIVYVTRHGQPLQRTQAQKEDPEFPPGDPPLSALGREQAQRLGECLKVLGFAGTIYASPYRRTAETADEIAEVLDIGVRRSKFLSEDKFISHMCFSC